ncbi:MAG: chromosome segregation protein SMC [Acidobacteria bacterium]|nr:chromosome segregation protein SMC [Acidobacteriota bacterium]
MLILKRVEIQGFKSFCERTEMRFAGKGVAAVVGPNGCGKSNLSDAISWVLGEQSAKSLRGGRMEDVIFAGTRDRKPLGMAQVSMVLVDPTGSVAIPGARPEPAKPFKKVKTEAVETAEAAANEQVSEQTETVASADTTAEPEKANGANAANPLHGFALHAPGKEQEITVTRRLFRSGESEYLINGKMARLRDIQDIFMGTGLGPESYAIIEQGRIGQILSSKPLDRRAVIEEAAGISRFKTKRRLAEAKLEGAKQNLTRVFDILEEVSRQVNSLKRQAGKAKRYEELKTELDGQLRVALTGRYMLLEREAARVALELGEATRLFQELHARVEQEEGALTAARQAFYQVEANLTEARKRLAEVRIEAERTSGLIDSQARQIAGIEQRLQQGEAEGEEMDARLTALEQERAHLAAQLEELQKQANEARERLMAKNAEKEAVQAQLRDQERALEQSRQQVVRLLGESSQLKNQLGQIDTYLSSIDRDTVRVSKDEETAVADLARLDAAKAELTGKLSSRQLELESTEDRRKNVAADLQQRRAAALETRRELDTLKTETSRLRARRDSLEEILSHRAYTAESVKRLFTAVESGQAQGFKPAGVLADFVELTHPQFEKATEEFLHEELEYVVVKRWDDAQRGIEILRGDLDGRATFLVEPHLNSDSAPVVSSPVHEPAIGPETGIVGRLSDGIRFTNGLTNAPAALLPRLARCFLAESRESAQRLSVMYPDLFFLLSDGVCYSGHAVSGGRRTGAGPLALKRELREVGGLFQERHNALTTAQTAIEELEAGIQTLSADLELLRTEQQRQEKETLVLDQEMRKIAEEHNRASQKLSVARIELERLTREAGRSRQQREEKLALVEEKDVQRAAVEQALEQGRAGVEALKSQLGVLAEEHSIARVELAGCEERRRGVDNALARLDHQVREVAARRQNLAAEMERLGLARNRLLENNLELQEKAASLSAEQSGFEQTVEALAATETGQRAALTAAEETIKSLRAGEAEAQEKRGQIELDLVRRQAGLQYLDETCRKDLSVPVAELAAAADASVELDELAVADLEERVTELRKRIEALGPVNPEALAEYQEAQQRYDFLNTQRQDLLDSIRDTEKAIHEIDTESRKRFIEAFTVINENFKDMFRVLFGGGIGEMRLTGDGDALDQGIEIVASPPGKRLQNVLLLSGGEKALTAVALLMAIFHYQPSPFCILDEVDAPLDEANVGRLATLLKDMAAQTQFIVITHAKKTMESAEMLYGVTMQEQGVSKLVSVRLQPAAPPPPPPPALQTAARA